MGNPSRKPRTENKTYYNIRSTEINDNNMILCEKYFKTKNECSSYYKCCPRLIGYKIKNKNDRNSGKLKNILLYKCKEPIQYQRNEIDISKNFKVDELTL